MLSHGPRPESRAGGRNASEMLDLARAFCEQPSPTASTLLFPRLSGHEALAPASLTPRPRAAVRSAPDAPADAPGSSWIQHHGLPVRAGWMAMKVR